MRTLVVAAISAVVLGGATRARADGLALESYVGKRPADADRVMSALRAVLEKHGYLVDPEALRKAFAEHEAKPGIQDPRFNGEKLAQAARDGERHFADLDFNGAAQILGDAIRVGRANPAVLVHEPKFRDAMYRALVYYALASGRLGSVHERAAGAEKTPAKHDQLAKDAAAEATARDESMAELIRAFPNKVIVAREWGQEAENLYTRVRQDSDSLGRGKLAVDVNDPVAVLYIDDVPRGQGSVTIGDLVPGRYRVLVQPTKGDWREYSLDVLANQTARLTIDLDLDRALVLADWVGFDFETDKDRAREAELAVKLARLDTNAASVSTFTVTRKSGHLALVGTTYNTLDGSLVRSGEVELKGPGDEHAMEQLVSYLDGTDVNAVAHVEHPEYVKPDVKKLPSPRVGAISVPTKASKPSVTQAEPPKVSTPSTRQVPVPATETDSERIRMTKAEALFDEARKLVDAGKADEACAKFEQSLKLNPNAIGSILNVARCREDAGRVASATRMFTEARDRAIEQHLDEYRRAADEHLAALSSRVPYLHVEFTEDPTPETRLLIDNTLAPISSSDIPVDPGTRTITVSQPGRVSYERKFVVVEHQRVAVHVPKLARPIVVSHTRRTVGKIFAATGGVTALGALGIAWYARNLWQDQFKAGHCENESAARPMCDDQGYTATHNARTYGTIGTGLGIASAALIAVGGYLWFTAPSGSSTVAVLPAVEPDQIGLAAMGRF